MMCCLVLLFEVVSAETSALSVGDDSAVNFDAPRAHFFVLYTMSDSPSFQVPDDSVFMKTT
jgi:hypothetical protein